MDFIVGREWQYVMILISLFIFITGLVTGRKMPAKVKRTYVRKFACAALIPMGLMIYFERPYVSFVPKTFLFREQRAENPASFEEIANYEKDQTRNIELLKEEVENLRKELDAVNDYYGGLAQLLVTITLTFCILRILKKDENDLEEIQPDQVSKL